jgi:hypothetical protein
VFRLFVGLGVVMSSMVLAMVLGCSGKHQYDVVRENVSTGMLYNVVIRFGEFEAGPSVLMPGTSKTRMSVSDRHPYPDTATVEWALSDGSEFSRAVKVPEFPDGKMSRGLVFRFYGGDALQVLVE